MAFIGHAVDDMGKTIEFEDFVHPDYREQVDIACNQVALAASDFVGFRCDMAKLTYVVGVWEQLCEEGVEAYLNEMEENQYVEEEEEEWEEGDEEDDEEWDDSEYEEPYMTQEDVATEPEYPAVFGNLLLAREDGLTPGAA